MSAAAVTEAQPKVPFKVAISSFLGNFIEWFDYATYTYFAITIGIVFFPESAVNSTLLAFAVFALSFVFRPLGAAFWGRACLCRHSLRWRKHNLFRSPCLLLRSA